VLSVVIVGMGVSLGREGAPNKAGAGAGQLLFRQERACPTNNAGSWWPAGAGAGMGAAYGVPLGGALFALEVMRGMLALRYVLPALIASVVATAVSWVALPDAPTYMITGLFQLHLECGLGARGWADRGSGVGRLCSGGHMGRSQ